MAVSVAWRLTAEILGLVRIADKSSHVGGHEHKRQDAEGDLKWHADGRTKEQPPPRQVPIGDVHFQPPSTRMLRALSLQQRAPQRVGLDHLPTDKYDVVLDAVVTD